MNNKNKVLLAVVVVAILALLLLSINFHLADHTTAPEEKSLAAAATAKPAATTVQPAVALPVTKPAQPSDTANVVPIRPAVAGGTGALPNDAATLANMRNMVMAYRMYTTISGGGRTLEANYGDSVHAAAVLLAQKIDLNDAALFFTPGDPLTPKTRPKSVIIGDIRDVAPEINPDFASATLSFVLVANLPTGSPPSTTPVMWTRGLREDGTWAPDSPYGGKGGYIAYLDGHVEWAERLSTGPNGTAFVTYAPGDTAGPPTTNVKDTLPPGAVILSAEPNGKQR